MHSLLQPFLKGMPRLIRFSPSPPLCVRKWTFLNRYLPSCGIITNVEQGTRFRSYSQNFPALKMEDLKLHVSGSGRDKVIVRRVQGVETMNISFYFQGKDYNLLRGQSETLERTFTRISQNLKKSADKMNRKRVKKMKATPPSANGEISSAAEFSPLVSIPECSIIHNGSQLVPLEAQNKEAWVNGAIFCIGDLGMYNVLVNLPTILKLKLPSHMIAGCPLFPLLETEFADEDHCQFSWYSEVVMETVSAVDAKGCADRKWQLVSCERTFTPTDESIGKKLLLKCTPTYGERQGETAEVTSSSEVVQGPENVPFVKRHRSTTERTTGRRFRVMTYNLLADVYANSEFARDFLFLHCPPQFLSADYRQQLLLKEIVGYHGDILCLQEVDKSFFSRLLQPALTTDGLEGVLFCKSGGVAEGEAIFYYRDRYSLIGQHNIVLADKLMEDPANSDLVELVSKAPKFSESVTSKSSVAQVVVLDDTLNPGKRLIVANTHLYFHPNANHVRMVQVYIILRHLQQLQTMYNEQDPEKSCSILFAGDLNSNIKSGVYELISSGVVPANSAHWFTAGREEYCGGMELRHPLQLRSACPELRYTNYVPGFMDTIDHIVYSEDSIGLERAVPMPTHEEVTGLTALPNEVFPSDHLPLICDLQWLS